MMDKSIVVGLILYTRHNNSSQYIAHVPDVAKPSTESEDSPQVRASRRLAASHAQAVGRTELAVALHHILDQQVGMDSGRADATELCLFTPDLANKVAR